LAGVRGVIARRAAAVISVATESTSEVVIACRLILIRCRLIAVCRVLITIGPRLVVIGSSPIAVRNPFASIGSRLIGVGTVIVGDHPIPFPGRASGRCGRRATHSVPPAYCPPPDL
jgi:hypothetical protein